MADLFVAHSPYHVLLATGVARPGSTLILITDFAAPDCLVSALSGWAGSPFARLIVLPGGSSRSAASQVLRRSLNSWTLARARLGTPERMFVSNDYLPEDQALMHRLGKSPGLRLSYLEDGVAAYRGSAFHFGEEWWRRALRKLAFGPWYRYVRVLGTHPAVREALLLYPEHARPELAHLALHAYDADALRGAAVRALVERYLEAWGRTRGPLADVERVLLLTHSELFGKLPKYREGIRGLCAQAGSIGVKYHPRDGEGDPLGLVSLPGVSVVPQALPVEYIFLARSERLDLVVGDISTGLMSVRWIAPRARVVSLAPLLGVNDERLLQVFGSIGIEVRADLAGVA